MIFLEAYSQTLIEWKYQTTARLPMLIIFDEIQMCERALTSLKYFAEETPEYHVIFEKEVNGIY